MNREFIVWKLYKIKDKPYCSSERVCLDSWDFNVKDALIREHTEYAKDDPDFIRVKIESVPNGQIDWDLLDRMSAIREMCELGHKVRANTKIRNRQPLRTAYVSFSDRDIQDYMVYVDGRKNSYAEIIGEELNVLDVVFMDEEIENKVFDYNMKPNFKSLGPKGFGKQAQAVKTFIQAMSIEDRNALHAKLKSGETVSILDVPLNYTDVEVEFAPKANYMSASSKSGAIVLDTTLDESMVNIGFVADFRSAIQNIRKSSNLNVSDKIFLEIFCAPNRAYVIDKSSIKLKKDLLATDIKFFSSSEANPERGHRLYFHNNSLKTSDQVKEIGADVLDKEIFYVNLYKES